MDTITIANYLADIAAKHGNVLNEHQAAALVIGAEKLRVYAQIELILNVTNVTADDVLKGEE